MPEGPPGHQTNPTRATLGQPAGWAAGILGLRGAKLAFGEGEGHSRDLLQHRQHAWLGASLPRGEGFVIHHHPLVVVPARGGDRVPRGHPEHAPGVSPWGVPPPCSRAAVELGEDGGPLGAAAGQPVGHDVPQPLQDAALRPQVLPERRVAVADGGLQSYLRGGEGETGG